VVDLPHEEIDPVFDRQFGVVVRGKVAVDVLDHHHGRIDDDAEVNRSD
jgi:hypothetical protein